MNARWRITPGRRPIASRCCWSKWIARRRGSDAGSCRSTAAPPAGRLGPRDACLAAGWSPDGRWMYLNAQVGGSFHLWRQRFPDGAPEQITFGPAEEEGLAVSPDGASLVTSVGVRRSAIWMHEPAGERPVTSEGFAFAPHLSTDGRRVYYLSRQTATAASEIWTTDLALRPQRARAPRHRGLGFRDLARRAGGRLHGATRWGRLAGVAGGARSALGTAPGDRRRPIASRSGAGDTLIVRALGERSNTLVRVKKDGSGRERIGSYVILDKGQVSAGGAWVIAGVDGRTATSRDPADHGHSGRRRGTDPDLRARLRRGLVTRRTVPPDRGRGRHQQVRVHGRRPDAGDSGSAGPCRSGVASRRQPARFRLDGHRPARR